MLRDTSEVRPRWATPRDLSRPSYGDAIAKVAAALGKPLQPWQRQIADVATELLPDGTWAYRKVVIHVQRQGGKTTLILPVSLHRTLIRALAKTWFTAQRRQDARDTWLDCAELVKAGPLDGLIRVRRSNGSEALTTPTGSTFRVFAPNEDGLHGKANELVTVDEGWSFDGAEGAALQQAINPTFATTGGQLWLPSTAGTSASTWYRGHVEQGRAAVEAGANTGVAYFEWSLDDVAAARCTELLTDLHRRPGGARAAVEVDPSAAAMLDEVLALVLAAHPGAFVRADVIRDDALGMPPGEFLRAYGNVWTRTSDRVIPEHVWRDARDRTLTPPEGDLVLAFDVAVDRSSAAIAGAWRDAAGVPAIDVLDARAGAGWVAQRVEELAARWRVEVVGVDAAGPALDVVDELERRGRVKVARYGGRDYVAACAGLLAAAHAGLLKHRGNPDLDAAVEAAARRDLGDGWAWSRRRSAASIAPLVAATVALWAYDHRPEPPARPVVVAGRRPPSTGSRSTTSRILTA